MTPTQIDTLTVSAPVTDSGGAVTVSDNQINYRPAADFYGTETITYTLTDGNGGTDTGTVTVTVDPVNDAPFMIKIPSSLWTRYCLTRTRRPMMLRSGISLRRFIVARTTGSGKTQRVRWPGSTRSRTLVSRHVTTTILIMSL